VLDRLAGALNSQTTPVFADRDELQKSA